jgi:uncharacterized protein YabE (DUF348 family)
MFKSFIKRILRLRYIIPAVVIILFLSGAAYVRSAKKTFTITADSSSNTYTSFAGTVREALSDGNITLGIHDTVTPGLDEKIHEGEKIIVERAKNISIEVDGEILFLTVSDSTLQEVLTNQEIILDGDDKISLNPSTEISDNLNVKIVRVYTKVTSSTLPVEYSQEVQKRSSLPNTRRYVSRGGVQGERTVMTRVTYEDGVEISSEVISDQVTREPVSEIVVQGSYPVMPVAADGSIMAYSSVSTCRATAYWAIYGVGTTYTASGRRAVRNPDGYSTIAVDPKVYPYGTKLFIEGYGFAIAADCGTGIKGNRIDVYFNTYKEACNWGAKYVKVYVLE